MKLIETKCPNCNSQIKVEPRKKIVCEYCGANFLLEDNTIKVKHIASGGITEEQEFINAETNLNKLKNYKEAYDIYLSLSKRYVDDASIWIGLLRCLTKDFSYKVESISFRNNYEKYWNNFIALADKKEVRNYEEKYNNYVDNVKFSRIENNKLNNSELADDKCFVAVTILGGWFGLHKFLKGEKKLGILYLFTYGLFFVGWIYDMVNECKKWPESSQYKIVKLTFFSFLIFMGLGSFSISIYTALLCFIAAFLVLDFIWKKTNFNYLWLRILVPLVLFYLAAMMTA